MEQYGMGTYQFIRLLIKYSLLTSHPLYHAEIQNTGFTPFSQIIGSVVRRVWKPVGAVICVMVMLGVADFLCGNSHHALANVIFSVCLTAGGIFALLLLLLITYLWPLAVAIASSSVIVQERERRTWDMLLTTAMDWQDIVLIKLAAVLRRFTTYFELFLWLQSFLIIIIFVLVIGNYASYQSGYRLGLFDIPLVILAMVEFAIARTQDYVLATLAGLASSLFAPTRQLAAAGALSITMVLLLVRVFVTLLITLALPFDSIPALLILLVTGPSSVVAIAWRGLLAVLILIGMIVGREVLIRYLFKWLISRLGENVEVTA